MKMSTQQFILALIMVGMLVVDLLILAFVALPTGNKDTFNLFLGTQLGIIAGVAAFAFPSNVSNAAKDHTIATLAAKASPSDTTTQVTTQETVTTKVAQPTQATAQTTEGAEDNGTTRPV